VLKPEQHKASALVSAITAQRQSLVTAQANYAAGKAAQVTIKSDGPEWAALRKAVPNTSDIPSLLRVLEDNANAVHVKMQAITLSGAASTASATTPSTTPPSTTGTTSTPSTTGTTTTPSTTGAQGAGETASSTATSIPLSLTFAGGYVALHNLVRRLDGLVVVSGHTVHATGPLLSISSVSLTGSPKLTVQLTATIYQLAAPSSATTATPGGQS
jgi:hypothetical protein